MCRNRTECNAYIHGLSQLLEPGGTLLLKWDCKSLEQLSWWRATRAELLSRLQLVDMRALYAASCSRAHLDLLKQEGGVEPLYGWLWLAEQPMPGLDARPIS